MQRERFRFQKRTRAVRTFHQPPTRLPNKLSPPTACPRMLLRRVNKKAAAVIRQHTCSSGMCCTKRQACRHAERERTHMETCLLRNGRPSLHQPRRPNGMPHVVYNIHTICIEIVSASLHYFAFEAHQFTEKKINEMPWFK